MSWLSNLIIFELIRTWSDIGRDYSRHPVSRVIDYSDTIFTDRVRCLLLHPQSRILDLCSREIVQHPEPSLLTMISLFHPFRCIYRTKALLTSNFTSCWNVFCNWSCKDGSLQDHITKSSPLHWPALYILLDPRKLLPPDHPSTSTPNLLRVLVHMRLDSLERKACFEIQRRTSENPSRPASSADSSYFPVHLNISKHFSWGQDNTFLLWQFYYLLLFLLETLNHSLSMDSVYFLLSLELERSTLVVFFWSIPNIAPGNGM